MRREVHSRGSSLIEVCGGAVENLAVNIVNDHLPSVIIFIVTFLGSVL